MSWRSSISTRRARTHYEVANWAKQPDLDSRHNTLYWRNGEYIGFGAGAHWASTTVRTMNHLLPQTYIAAVDGGEDARLQHARDRRRDLSMGETMMLGLRLLREGISASQFEARHGVRLEAAFGNQLEELDRLGLLLWDGAHARLTKRGLMLANEVCGRFL